MISHGWLLGFDCCSLKQQEEPIPLRALSEIQLEIRKHMRSETQGDSVKAYLSFCCLVYVSLMGRFSFIYSTQKLTCQTTHRLTPQSPEKPVTVAQVSKTHRFRCELLLLHWEDRVFIFLKWALYLRGALFGIPTGLKLTDITIYFSPVCFFPYLFSPKRVWNVVVVLYAGLRATAGLSVCNIIK